tara:strand:+ start:3012 stop:3599 length:588 start_codon:yes stop_codon:yes gene_type:complete
MLELADKSLTPPDGWRYMQRESRQLLRSTSFNNLVDAVRDHRVANGYPIQMDFEREVEEGVCLQIPEACKEAPDRLLPLRLKIANVMRFTITLGESILKGSPRVDSTEANRRASICSDCPANVRAEGCGGCNSTRVNELVEKLTGAKPTNHDDKLESCKYCGCFNKAQVWFPLDLLQKHTSEEIREELPENCWKK